MPVLSSSLRVPSPSFPTAPGLRRARFAWPAPCPVTAAGSAPNPAASGAPQGHGGPSPTGAPDVAAASEAGAAPGETSGPSPDVVRVLLADDHPLLREGVKSCLAAAPGIKVVGEVSDGGDVVARAAELSPDVVLMDLNMPGLNGLEATERLRRELPAVRVLVFTIHHEPQYVAQLLRAGAHGYVTKDAPPDELMAALRRVGRGGTYFSSEVAQGFLGAQLSGVGRNGAVRLQSLSPRELEVLKLIADGLGNKQIAARLDLSTRTVETHRERIMRKLDLHSVAALTRFAVAQGLVGLE